MKKLVAVVLCIWILITCAACDGYTTMKKYPYYKSDCWYCEEIDFTFCFEYHEDGRMKPMTYSLEWDGNIMTVNVDFIVDNWYIYMVDNDGITTYEEQLLEGVWHYEGKNLVFKITKDNLLDGQFTELTFVPVD